MTDDRRSPLAGHRLTLTLAGDQFLFIHALASSGLEMLKGNVAGAAHLASLATLMTVTMGRARTAEAVAVLRTQCETLRTINGEPPR